MLVQIKGIKCSRDKAKFLSIWLPQVEGPSAENRFNFNLKTTEFLNLNGVSYGFLFQYLSYLSISPDSPSQIEISFFPSSTILLPHLLNSEA